jgi:hypothetical protein
MAMWCVFGYKKVGFPASPGCPALPLAWHSGIFQVPGLLCETCQSRKSWWTYSSLICPDAGSVHLFTHSFVHPFISTMLAIARHHCLSSNAVSLITDTLFRFLGPSVEAKEWTAARTGWKYHWPMLKSFLLERCSRFKGFCLIVCLWPWMVGGGECWMVLDTEPWFLKSRPSSVTQAAW